MKEQQHSTSTTNERVDPAWVGLVKAKMKHLGWDGKRLAEESGVSTATVSRLLKCVATQATLTRVANALGISDLAVEQLQTWLTIGAELREVDLGRFLSAAAFFQEYVTACRIVQSHTATIAQAQATFAQMTAPEAISLAVGGVSAVKQPAAPVAPAPDGHSDGSNGKKRR